MRKRVWVRGRTLSNWTVKLLGLIVDDLIPQYWYSRQRKVHDIFTPGSESSVLFSLTGPKVQRNFRCWERKFHEIFAPRNDSSTTFSLPRAPGSESSLTAKVPVTRVKYYRQLLSTLFVHKVV